MAIARHAAADIEFDEAIGLLKTGWKSVRSMAGVIYGSVSCKPQEKPVLEIIHWV